MRVESSYIDRESAVVRLTDDEGKKWKIVNFDKKIADQQLNAMAASLQPAIDAGLAVPDEEQEN